MMQHVARSSTKRLCRRARGCWLVCASEQRCGCGRPAAIIDTAKRELASSSSAMRWRPPPPARRSSPEAEATVAQEQRRRQQRRGFATKGISNIVEGVSGSPEKLDPAFHLSSKDTKMTDWDPVSLDGSDLPRDMEDLLTQDYGGEEAMFYDHDNADGFSDDEAPGGGRRAPGEGASESVPHLGRIFLASRSGLRPFLKERDIPRSVLRRRGELLKDRTHKQLTGSYKRLVKAENRARNGVEYSQMPLGYDLPTPTSRGPLRTGQTQRRHRTMTYGPDETLGMVSHRMLARFLVAQRVMRDARARLPRFQPRSVLDFGCGPGTATLAARSVWGPREEREEEEEEEEVEESDDDEREGAEAGSKEGGGATAGFLDIERLPFSRAHLVDCSQSMLDCCKVTTKDLVEEGTRVHLGRSLVAEEAACQRDGSERSLFDLVLCSHTLSELPTHEARAAAVELMWACVAPGGLLIMTDIGGSMGSHVIRSARKLLLEEGSPGQAAVIGPCPHDGPCPLDPEREQDQKMYQGKKGKKQGPGGVCNFFQMVPNVHFRRDGLDKSRPMVDVFSYVVMKKRTRQAMLGQEPCDVEHSSHIDFSLQQQQFQHEMEQQQQQQQQQEGGGGFGADGGQFGFADDGGADQTTMLSPPTPYSSVDLLKVFLERKLHCQSEEEQEEADAQFQDAMMGLERVGVDASAFYRQDWARIIRSPRKHRKHVALDVCTPEGGLRRVVVTKGKHKKVPGYYIAARKSKWGAMWPNLSLDGGENIAASAAAGGVGGIGGLAGDDDDTEKMKAAFGRLGFEYDEDMSDFSEDEEEDEAGGLGGEGGYGADDEEYSSDEGASDSDSPTPRRG